MELEHYQPTEHALIATCQNISRQMFLKAHLVLIGLRVELDCVLDLLDL